jgi:hypothetical protein
MLSAVSPTVAHTYTDNSGSAQEHCTLQRLVCIVPLAPPGSQVSSRAPSPLRTGRARFLALRSRMLNAPRGTRRYSCAVWCVVSLTVTMGREADQMRPSIVRMVTIPVMSCEVVLALDHLAAVGTPLPEKPNARAHRRCQASGAAHCWAWKASNTDSRSRLISSQSPGAVWSPLRLAASVF